MTAAGKQGASEQQVVTYKHLLERQDHNLRNPLRCIAHCDIDSAYAQFQAVRLGLGPEAPVACDQWSHLLAVNYTARRLGVKPFMRVWEAKAVCPELVCPHVATYKAGEDEAKFHEDPHPSTHKVSLEPFRRESKKIMSIFAQFCPALGRDLPDPINVVVVLTDSQSSTSYCTSSLIIATVEKASIDEAYLDLTETVRLKILERCPHLRTLPASASPSDPIPPPPVIDWKDLGLLEVPSIPDDAAGPPDLGNSRSVQSAAWQAYAFALAAEIMLECRTQVKLQLGYTCSAGIAGNKFLAKICSGNKKPDGQTVLLDSACSYFLEPLAIGKVPTLKRKFGQEIKDSFNAATLGDLWQYDVRDLQAKLGEQKGLWLFDASRGREYSRVIDRRHTASMLSRKDFLPPLTTIAEIDKALEIVAVDLFVRLTEARAVSPLFWPKTLVFGARLYNDYRSASQHTQAPIAFSAQNFSLEAILAQARQLVRVFFKARVSQDVDSKTRVGTVTNLSLAFEGLEAPQVGQQDISRFFGKTRKMEDEDVRGSPSKRRGAKGGSRGSAADFIDLTQDEEAIVIDSDSE